MSVLRHPLSSSSGQLTPREVNHLLCATHPLLSNQLLTLETDSIHILSVIS